MIAEDSSSMLTPAQLKGIKKHASKDDKDKVSFVLRILWRRFTPHLLRAKRRSGRNPTSLQMSHQLRKVWLIYNSAEFNIYFILEIIEPVKNQSNSDDDYAEKPSIDPKKDAKVITMRDDSESDSDDIFIKQHSKKLKAKKRLLDDSNSDSSTGKKAFKAKRGRAKQAAGSDSSDFEANSDEESESDDASDLNEAEDEDAITIGDESDDASRLIDDDEDSDDFVKKTALEDDDDNFGPVRLSKEPPKRAVDHNELSNILVNPDHGTNEKPVYFPQFLINVLKAHQIDGVRFMWKRVIKSVEEVAGGDRGGACILAHSMGLGKTIQVVSFLHIVSRYSKQLKLRKILVIVPVNTLHNWKSEVYKWLGSTGYNADLKVFMIQDTTSS